MNGQKKSSVLLLDLDVCTLQYQRHNQFIAKFILHSFNIVLARNFSK